MVFFFIVFCQCGLSEGLSFVNCVIDIYIGCVAITNNYLYYFSMASEKRGGTFGTTSSG